MIANTVLDNLKPLHLQEAPAPATGSAAPPTGARSTPKRQPDPRGECSIDGPDAFYGHSADTRSADMAGGVEIRHSQGEANQAGYLKVAGAVPGRPDYANPLRLDGLPSAAMDSQDVFHMYKIVYI